ncbi:MAG: DUF799 family lipoprotein [Deltaproteobacteria bacterium]|nr:DUF799 family lipoprotein [Deltaproteobacteria bacterium]
MLTRLARQCPHIGRHMLVVIILLSGCAGRYNQSLDFNPSEPLRIAVLPFVSVDGSGAIVEDEGRLVLDNLALVSKKQDDNPAQIVRKQVLAELEKTNLELVSIALIDVDLPHHGFGRPDGTIDIKKVFATAPADLCSQFLNCDAILYGKVTKWDRSYYAVQSVNSVGVELSLVAARDGRTLFTSKGEDAASRGVTKGPTGFSDLVLEPIRGLDSEIIVDLSRDVVRKMIAPLYSKSRPEFLETAPPTIFAVSHDAQSPVVSRGQPLIVVMLATPGISASFSIGNAIENVPMAERSPGHYYGEFVPLPTDRFENLPVKLTAIDKYGRTAVSTVAKPALSLSSDSSANVARQ